MQEEARIFLEVNYKTDVNLLFGLIGVEPGVGTFPNYEFGLVPKDEWNKVYFELTDQVILSDFENYQIGLQAAIPFSNGDFTLDTARIHLDNLKLITF